VTDDLLRGKTALITGASSGMGEKVLPVLDAAHKRPHAKDGTNNPNNGLLLRSDLHPLFDKGGMNPIYNDN
jgi:hypothetical protein